MKPKIAYTLTSDSVIQDTVTQKYTLIGVFDDILRKKGVSEAVISSFVIFFKIIDAVGATKIEIKIHTPSGAELFKTPLIVEGFGVNEKSSLSVAATLQNISFTEVGPHEVQIIVNDIEAISSSHQVINVIEVD